MEAGLREVCRSVRIGKILIQRVCYRLHSWRDRFIDTIYLPTGRGNDFAQAVLFEGTHRHVYHGHLSNPLTCLQFPADLASRYVLLLDPMLGKPVLHSRLGG